MLEAVAGQRGVVRLDVDPVLVREVVAHEEGIHRRGVVVVLMLRRLLRLRLEQQGPGEPDSMLVLRDEVEESRELRFLSGEIGVEERLVALAPTPQDVIRPPQPMRRLEHVLDLGGRIREHLGVRIRRRPGGVSRVAEEIRGAPEQPDAGALHVGFDVVHHGLEPVACLRERAALGRDVTVVEREERGAELRHELERGVDLRTCRLHRVRAGLQPRSIEGSDAEDIRPGPVERVPQADGDAEVVLHPLAEHHAIGLVDLEGQRVRRFQTTERDALRHIGEEASHAHLPPCSSPAHAARTTVSEPFVNEKHKSRAPAIVRVTAETVVLG